MTSFHLVCKCGKTENWVSDEHPTDPCPICGRVYKVIQNRKTKMLEAMEIYNPAPIAGKEGE